MSLTEILVVVLALVVSLGGTGLAIAAVRAAVARDRRAAARDLEALLERAAVEQHQLAVGVADSVLHAAGARFDDRLAATDRELALREAAIEGQLDARNAEVGSQMRELRDLLSKVTDTMAQLQSDRATQHGEFVTHLEQAARSQQVLADTAGSLRDALANPKSRGSWGERTAEDLLRHLGFIEGVNYRRQRQLAGGTTPDFTFILPEGRELNMDVKFPADNYLRFLEADNELDRERLRKAFLADVRGRMKELADRGYVDPDRTVDYLLLFIPNESVYSFIHEHDAGIVDAALGQKIILCSPFTLFGVLAVVRQSVQLFRLERRGDEILQCLSDFSKQWERFGTQIDKVDKQIATLTNVFGELNGARRNQLQRQVDRIAELGSGDGAGDGDPVGSAPAGGDTLLLVDAPVELVGVPRGPRRRDAS